MITNLYLVRHAHSTYTPEELKRPLSEKGFKDAHKVTELIKSENIDRVISSPYLRAVQTVKELASILGKDVEIVDNFKERKLIDGVTNNFEETIEKVWQDPYFAWKGGESNDSAQQRGVKGINMVLDNYKGENIVIGTHGNIMVLMMNFFDKQYDFEFWRNLTMPDIYKLSFKENNLISCIRVWKEI